jgi:hypothetical protein
LAKELSGKIRWISTKIKDIDNASISCSSLSEVFKARAKNDNKFVAMKRVLMENEKEGVSEIHPEKLFRHFMKLFLLFSVSNHSAP